MASSSRPAKQLKELLQEQQEPFVLTTYLSERRYMRSSLNSDTKKSCSPNNSAKNSKRSTFGPELSTKRERIENGSSFLRSVLNKLASNNECYKHSTYNVSEIRKKVTPDNSSKSNVMYNHQFFKENHGSSSSTSTFQAFEPFDIRGLELATDKNLQWAFMDDRKLSPASVLEILLSNQAQHFFIARQEEILSTSSFNLQKRITESSIASASPWELLIRCHPGIAKLEEIFGFVGSQYLKTRRIMQNTKGVPFDCAKEAIEIHGKNNVQKNQEFLGDQEPLENNCKRFCYWEKQCRDATSTTKPINSDFSTTKQEWSDSHPLTIEIGIEIADAIMDQMVTDIINFFL